jgi:hypothetical protein
VWLLVSILLAPVLDRDAAAQNNLRRSQEIESAAVGAQTTATAPPPPPHAGAAGDVARFLGGAALGLGLHEGAHLLTDCFFDAHPGIKKVQFGPLPFFAITHRPVSPRREYTISSAGFWVQQLGSEILLSRHPGLRAEHAPAQKGLLAFNVLASVAYAVTAMARAGPLERDTRSMAVSLGTREPAVGAMLLAPALLDTARYFHPANRWLPWASRAAKVAMVLLVAKNGSQR